MAGAIHIVCPHCNAVNRLPSANLKKSPKCGKCKEALFMGYPTVLDSSNFHTHISRNDIPVLVDYWAAWSEDSRTMAPVIALAAARLEPRMRIAKVNRDTEQEIVKQQAIMSVPTLVLYRNGREVDRTYGPLDIASLIKWLKSRL